ncbi:oxygenase MpaB family protein [Polyangium sp. 6x1]|uniref:oxygenase MpaB family protein n=1 Tax=Polyangium sp. 6x1 TaxID=3042689 RepID=UPI002482AFD3|nr:oxygenase MpaB family protein [Polyangium sp. 6x1]MDI1445015.1 oxygenase MpaB family protein [Polyangium sp. 6x1]
MPGARESIPPISQKDPQQWERCLAYAREHAEGPVEGLFAQEGMVRRIWREGAMLAAIPPAVVLEVLLPEVAEGVGKFSDYQTKLMARTRRTVYATHALVFGDLSMSIEVGERIFQIHERVRGSISSRSSVTRRGERYRANDPAAMQWVFATLVKGALTTYEAVVMPLDRGERARFYEESKRWGAVVGLPPEQLPLNWESFERYFERMVEERLELGEMARDILRVLFGPPYMRGAARLCAGLLPERWRSAVGLPWDAEAKRAYERALGALRGARHLPPALRYVPAWHQAAARIEAARGGEVSRTTRIVQALDARGLIPAGLAPPERIMRKSPGG